MNDVIEEIINDLQRVADRKCYPEDIISGRIAQEWVVYITKLQTDNKRLQHNEKVFKDRNKKAIEYMKLIQYDKTDKYIPISDYDEYKKLLNILQGSDKY